MEVPPITGWGDSCVGLVETINGIGVVARVDFEVSNLPAERISGSMPKREATDLPLNCVAGVGTVGKTGVT